MSIQKDRTGQRYGRLVVTGFVDRDHNGQALWKCVCDCGTELTVNGSSLHSGNTKSCGCYKRDMDKDKAEKMGRANKGQCMGIDSPSFKHGRQCNELTFKAKEEIRKRDDYKCQDCGEAQADLVTRLGVHHIDGDDRNHDEDNLISLCVRCHTIRSWDLCQIRYGRS